LLTLADANIHVICLPSHTSILTQPNDNGTNKMFHEMSAIETSKYRATHAAVIMQKGDANKVLLEAWKQVRLEPKTITASYERTGIWPLDRHATNYKDLSISKCLAFEPTAKDVASVAQRQERFKDYIVVKGQLGETSVVLHNVVAQASQMNFVKSALACAAL
jgi:hypothetical protein